jgi:hypothetical protein
MWMGRIMTYIAIDVCSLSDVVALLLDNALDAMVRGLDTAHGILVLLVVDARHVESWKETGWREAQLANKCGVS